MAYYKKLPFAGFDATDVTNNGFLAFVDSDGNNHYFASPTLPDAFNETLVKMAAYRSGSVVSVVVCAYCESLHFPYYGQFYEATEGRVSRTYINGRKQSTHGGYIVYRSWYRSTGYNTLNLPVMNSLDDALADMDDGDWEQGGAPVSPNMIQAVTVWLKFPHAGQPLAQTVARIRTDKGTAEGGAISWDPPGTEAQGGAAYTAAIPLHSLDVSYWSSSIGNHVAVIDTAGTDTRVRQAVLIRDSTDKTRANLMIYFTSTGVTSPYDDPQTDTSTPVLIPPLPNVSAVNTGFIGLYTPTAAELRQLASFLWSDNFIDNIKRVFNDPYNVLISLSVFPVHPTTSGRGEIKLGNVSSGVQCDKITNQYYEFDCGEIDIKSVYNSYIDHNPYTKSWIYLPYIGYRKIDIDAITDKTIGIKYHIDLLSGACVAYITAGGSVLDIYAGICNTQIPLTSGAHTGIVSGLSQMIGGVAGTVAGIGSGNYAAAISGGINATMGAMMTQKVDVEKGGTIASSSAMMSPQTPYIIIERPVQALPENQQHYTGFPSFKTAILSDLSGYTQVANIHLKGMTCTEQEAQEIENLLKEGVII